MSSMSASVYEDADEQKIDREESEEEKREGELKDKEERRRER
jgi:hypothetical protein